MHKYDLTSLEISNIMEVSRTYAGLPPKTREHSLSLRKVRTMSRLETMAERIQKDLPEFIKLVPPTERSEGLYRRIRHIQKTGECCGFPMSMEQLREIIALAGRESVSDACLYLCRVLDRVHIERTLKTASNRLRIDDKVLYVAGKIKLLEWQMKYLSDLISGKYSMSDIVDAMEIALKKEVPAHYFISIFKKGYKAPKKCYN